MSRLRMIPRAAALVLLLALLIGLPCVVVATIGVPLPSPARLATSWRQRRVPGDLVIRTGAFVFALLWAWFATTAVGEFAQILRARRDGVDRVEPLPAGPSGWVRGLVRVVAISSVSATAAIGSLLPMIRSSADMSRVKVAATAADDTVPSTSAPTTSAPTTGSTVVSTVVSAGRETPYSLAVAIGRPDLRDLIIDLNSGRPTSDGRTWTGGVFPAGMMVLLPDSATFTVPAAASAGPSAGSSLSSFASGLGSALLLSAGAVSVLEARRRRQWRAAGVGARIPLPSCEATRTEVVLRALDAPERIARLDVALRAAAGDLAAQGASVTAAVLGDHGEVCLHLRGAAVPDDPTWALDIQSGTWRLAAEVDLAVLAEGARTCGQPCPALVHLGGAPGRGEVFVDLEAVGMLMVDSPSAEAILRGMASSLAVSPFLDVARVFTVGLGDTWPGAQECESMDSPEAAIEAALMVLGSTPSLARNCSTFALRARGRGGEAWEPAIVVSSGRELGPAVTADVHAIGGGRGLAVACDAPVGGEEWVLRDHGDRHVLMPLGLTVHPIGLTDDDIRDVQEVLAAAAAEPEVHAPVVPIDAFGRADCEPFTEPEWALMVRVLGPVEVVACTGEVAAFERSKALELVVWLSQHRDRPTRTAARTALWDLDVRDATFANVVSDARRALARAVAPPDDADWVARTLTEDLPLHEAVLTDADLLAVRVAAARGRRAVDAIEVLRPGVALLGGLPFAGTNYLWTDAEGITSAHVLLATGAAIELAEHYLALGDIDGVFWATGQGLKVLAGHEELIALRMRAHARRGDLAGVRSEWESYERALAADAWAAAEPAAKLVALRRELLAGDRDRERALA